MGRELVDGGFAVPGLVDHLETDWVGMRREATTRHISIPAELPRSMRLGGWLIAHYSRPPHDIPSLEVEVHRRVRYQPDVRRRFARAFAASLDRFVQRYLRDGRAEKSSPEGTASHHRGR